jgi:hypothetical protein
MKITIRDFENDSQGRRFSDVLADPRIRFQVVLDYFNRPEVIRRMEESEIHHDRPPLAGVIKEFEHLPSIHRFFSSEDGHTTTRFRQAVGVVVRMQMESKGWQKAGKKGSLGTRAKVTPGTTAPGAYRNAHGLAVWFTRCERYTRSSASGEDLVGTGHDAR